MDPSVKKRIFKGTKTRVETSMASVAKVELVALCNVIVIVLQGKEKTFCIEVKETQRDCRCGYYNAKSDHF